MINMKLSHINKTCIKQNAKTISSFPMQWKSQVSPLQTVNDKFVKKYVKVHEISDGFINKIEIILKSEKLTF